ncbi:MAG: class I SAM-dependent methyltransferase [Methanomassiliicoccales archaeon]
MVTHRFNAMDRAQLKNELRKKKQPAEEIVERASPTLDEVCADLGCGTGYLSLLLVRRCKVVLAVDSQRQMLEDLMSSADELDKTRLVPIQAEATKLPLIGASLDRVVAVNMFHEVEDKGALAQEIERVLRPGGRCTLVDFQKKETSFGPPLHERIEESKIPTYFVSMRVYRLYSFEEYYHYELVRL